MPDIRPADSDGLAAAEAELRAGRLVAMPTETVYGLAADATDGEAVARIYAAKGRPSFNPLIAHVDGLSMANNHAEMDDLARALVAAFWPGPLTLVLPRKAGSRIADIVTAGLDTIALRAPEHLVPRTLIAALGRPLAAPSANRSEGVSPTTAQHVADSLGVKAPLILDGGPARIGLESTIVAVADGRLRLLRPGAVTAEQLAQFAPLETAGPGKVEAPGMMARHYAPGKPLRLNAETREADEFHIGFGAVEGAVNLSPAADLIEAAAKLFSALHMAEAAPEPRIAVAPIPHEGLGAAIGDRLERAATA